MTVFRYFTVYGPAGRPDMSLFRFVQWISEERPLRLYGDGTQSRDFTYVDDIARGTILGLRPLGYEVINLGGDSPHDLLELIGLVEAQTGKKARIEQHPMHAADVMATWADVEQGQAAARLAAAGARSRRASPGSASGTGRTGAWAKDVDTRGLSGRSGAAGRLPAKPQRRDERRRVSRSMTQSRPPRPGRRATN